MSWARLGADLGDLGVVLGHLGAVLGRLGAVLAALGPLLGCSWLLLGDLGPVLGRLWAALGLLLAALERSWDLRRRFWIVWGWILGVFWGYLDGFGVDLDRFAVFYRSFWGGSALGRSHYRIIVSLSYIILSYIIVSYLTCYGIFSPYNFVVLSHHHPKALLCYIIIV